MTAKNQFTFWSLTILGFVGLVYLFQSVLLPFVLGGAIAYLLNPAVQKLQRFKLSRNFSVLILLLVFLTFAVLIFAVFLPPLYREITQLIQEIPGYAKYLVTWSAPYIEQIQLSMGISDTEDLQALIGHHAGSGAHIIQRAAKGLMAGGSAFADFIALLVITPVMAYFMMQEWPAITKFIDDLLPRDHRITIMNLFKEIDQKLSGFIRGQISVVFLLALLYAVALMVAGLKYGFIIGLCAGLLSIIPMLGSILGLVVAATVAWFQTGDFAYMGMIAGIFVAGQIIEGYVLTPKLVGESVGLHPLWVFFAVMAGGSLFGIVGMLLAIPVAAIASVLVAFGMHHYKKSAFYKASTKKKATQKNKTKNAK